MRRKKNRIYFIIRNDQILAIEADYIEAIASGFRQCASVYQAKLVCHPVAPTMAPKTASKRPRKQA